MQLKKIVQAIWEWKNYWFGQVLKCPRTPSLHIYSCAELSFGLGQGRIQDYLIVRLLGGGGGGGAGGGGGQIFLEIRFDQITFNYS